jgi:hypothetical protein
VKETAHAGKFELPAVPAYAEFVDRSATGQEDPLNAFSELLAAPTGRHVFAFALAAFIDIVVFLLAYASGPYFFGLPEDRWVSAGAALDSSDNQIFLRNFLRKMTPSTQGMPRVASGDLTPGEQQFCLLLVTKGLAVQVREEDTLHFLLDQEPHQHMVESLATRGLVLRASAQQLSI